MAFGNSTPQVTLSIVKRENHYMMFRWQLWKSTHRNKVTVQYSVIIKYSKSVCLRVENWFENLLHACKIAALAWWKIPWCTRSNNFLRHRIQINMCALTLGINGHNLTWKLVDVYPQFWILGFCIGITLLCGKAKSIVLLTNLEEDNSQLLRQFVFVCRGNDLKSHIHTHTHSKKVKQSTYIDVNCAIYMMECFRAIDTFKPLQGNTMSLKIVTPSAEIFPLPW